VTSLRTVQTRPAEMTESGQNETLIGREKELRELLGAMRRRESRLIWGPVDAGKTALLKKAISELPEAERRNCIRWEGVASGRQLLSHFVGRLYELRDRFVRGKVHADGATETSLNRWLHKQTSLRLRGILLTSLTQGDYRLFVDQFPAPTQNMARLIREIMYRCKTPIYLAARDYSQAEIGCAWKLYWNDALRVRLGPLTERTARDLLEICIRRFSLGLLDLEGFREDILRASGRLPGSIVKMCALASQIRYHSGDQIKIKLLHVDYVMQSNPSTLNRAPMSVDDTSL
jgi:hypothetical protein